MKMTKLKMKNKKGLIGLIVTICWILIIVLIVIFLFIQIPKVVKEREQNKAYNAFCEERPCFCYCNYFSCEFKTSWSSQTGFSNETIELCNLAKKLNDKEMIFKAGCK